jgi:hypothetical protein
MRTASSRFIAAAVLLAGSPTLPAQVKVTVLPAAADPSVFYRETTWSQLGGAKRLTPPLVNLTFVIESGFRPAPHTTADPSLPARLRLAGLQAADFQEIADAVYDAFVADLKAQRLEILPYDPLAVNPGFQDLADHAARTGREQGVPASFETIASVSGARRTMTVVGRRCPWIESFMSTNFLAASRVTRELEATLPVVSFLVDFVAYSPGRGTAHDWREFVPAGRTVDAPPLRARPVICLSAATAAFLTPDARTAALTLTTPVGYEQPFVTDLRSTRGRDRAERAGGSYDAAVDAATYKAAVIAVLKAQVAFVARKLGGGKP